MQLSNSTILYHGSYCIVEKPDLSKCKLRKDFGQGFYTTTAHWQAKKFARETAERYYQKISFQTPPQNLKSYISLFRVQSFQDLNIKIFQTTDREWLHCIAAHRKRNIFLDVLSEYKQYDIIIGKIADDKTNMQLNAYLSGTFGEIGSDEADEDCIKKLLPQNLENQICFRTQKALNRLVFCGDEEYGR